MRVPGGLRGPLSLVLAAALPLTLAGVSGLWRRACGAPRWSVFAEPADAAARAALLQVAASSPVHVLSRRGAEARTWLPHVAHATRAVVMVAIGALDALMGPIAAPRPARERALVAALLPTAPPSWPLLLVALAGSGWLAWLAARQTLPSLSAQRGEARDGHAGRLDLAPSESAERARDLGPGVTPSDAVPERVDRGLPSTTTCDYAVCLLDRDGRVASWNEGAERLTGYSRADVVGRPHSMLCRLADAADGHPARELERARALGFSETEAVRVRRDGSEFRASVSTSAILDDAGTLRGFAQVTRDLTERRVADQALRHLSQRLLVAQEDERRRIARELHDEVGQVLTSVKLSLQWLRRDCGPAASVGRLDDSLANVDRAIAGVRDLALRLRPALLDELGLVSALRWYVDRFARSSQLQFELHLEPLDERLPLEVEVGCFRIAQEALTNVLRHAQARRVTVALERRPGELELRVRDDGRGFDRAAVQARAARGECAGLSGMRERVGLLDGALALESETGRGSLVRACFPLGAATPAARAAAQARA